MRNLKKYSNHSGYESATLALGKDVSYCAAQEHVHYDTKSVYLQSTGTQYISIPITAASGLKYVIDFCLTEQNSTQDTFVGAHNNQGYYQPSSTSLRMWNSSGSGGNYVYTFNERVTAILEITSSNSTFEIVGGTKYVGGRIASSNELALFAYHGGNYKAKMKLWSCKIYKDGTLIKLLKPALSEASGHVGEACLKDIINNTYYYNSGTDTFTFGSTTE